MVQTQSGMGKSNRVGSGTAFGTFGELLQGVLPNECGYRNGQRPDTAGDFLVTLPIAKWSTATVRLDPDTPTVRVEPAGKTKSLRLATSMLSRGAPGWGGQVRIDSELPEGKGVASSSADMVATARAIGDALGIAVSVGLIEDLLRDIEPSDGVMYPGIVAFYHREVRLRARLGTLPPLTIVGVDEGGQVDTVAFNRMPKPFSATEKDRYARLLDQVASAVQAGDLCAVGEVATASALMNQKLCAKQTLPDLMGISRSVGGFGVVVAHSGTTLGILFAADDPAYHRKVRSARRACAHLSESVLVEHTLHFETPGLASPS